MTEPRGQGDAAHHSLPWPRARVGRSPTASAVSWPCRELFFQFSNRANTLCHENRPHVGQPQRQGGVRMPVGNIPAPLETLSLGSSGLQKPSPGVSFCQLRQRPLHKEIGNVSLAAQQHCREVNTAQAQSCGPKTPRGTQTSLLGRTLWAL